MTDRPLVIYHGPNCPDGFTAAWVARRHFMERCGVEPELLAAKYGDEPPDVTGRDVVIVDFSYPRDVLIEMGRRARSIVVLDHHRTAAADLAGIDFAVFDMERSGAGLAWDHFFVWEPRPWLVDYVEDRDLWRWKLLHSREISAALRLLEFDVGTWDALARKSADDAIEEFRAIGVIVGEAHASIIREHVDRSQWARVRVSPNGYCEVPVVNASALMSEIGSELARVAPFAATWFVNEDGRYAYSLRSRADNPGHVDVSVIAKLHGGGGHKHAAGFTADRVMHEVLP